MESIHIDLCDLKMGIIGIKDLPRLKEISLGEGCKVAGLAVLQAEVNRHRNKPVLRLEKDWNHHDLGETEPLFLDAEESFPVIATTDDRSVLCLPASHELPFLHFCLFVMISCACFMLTQLVIFRALFSARSNQSPVDAA
jgi:disease resistance protein RPM1